MKIETLSLKSALSLYPALNAESATETVSGKYRFISTKNVLEELDSNGWCIQRVRQQNQGTHAAHRVTLVPETVDKSVNDALEQGNAPEGFPRVELFNSHNRSKRFQLIIGYFRLACEDGLITAFGPTDKLRQVHRFSDERATDLTAAIQCAIEQFPEMDQKVSHFQDRVMTAEEQKALADYATAFRFIYRAKTPRKFTSSERLLEVRRPEDNTDSLWHVYNRVQENLFRGINGFSTPITGYLEDTRLNQALWKGADLALDITGSAYNNALIDIVEKQREKMRARKN